MLVILPAKPIAMNSSKAEPLSAAELRQAAITLLSRRDYSRHELRQKLLPKAANPDDVALLLDDIEARGWQSDARFSEVFLRDRSQRYGPVRLRQELKQKGIGGHEAEQAFAGLEVDWYAQARAALLKKYGEVPTELAIKAKAYRFLAARGFRAEHINQALRLDDE